MLHYNLLIIEFDSDADLPIIKETLDKMLPGVTYEYIQNHFEHKKVTGFSRRIEIELDNVNIKNLRDKLENSINSVGIYTTTYK